MSLGENFSLCTYTLDIIKKRFPKSYTEIIKDIYKGAVTSMTTPCGEMGDFPTTIGLHQGLT